MVGTNKILLVKKSTILLIIVILFCQCSILNKKGEKHSIYAPSVYFSSMNNDTTFQFKEMVKDKYGFNNYITILSSKYDSLNNIKGEVKFFALIDKNSKIIEIQPIQINLKLNKKSYLFFENDKPLKDTTKWNTLKFFLESNCNKLDIINTKAPTDTVHPTYCVFMFI